MENHKENNECKSGERHHGDRHVAVFHEIDEFAACARCGTGEKRIAAKLEIGMVDTYNEAKARKSEGAIPYEIPVFPDIFFFPCHNGDDKYDSIGIKESAFDPAEYAGPEVCEFGIEQASDNTTDGDQERKKNSVFSEERTDTLSDAAIIKWCCDEYQETYPEDIGEHRKESKKISDVLDDRGHVYYF
jgi:hypothetical protein